jgi:hypothetical protein
MENYKKDQPCCGICYWTCNHCEWEGFAIDIVNNRCPVCRSSDVFQEDCDDYNMGQLPPDRM